MNRRPSAYEIVRAVCAKLALSEMCPVTPGLRQLIDSQHLAVFRSRSRTNSGRAPFDDQQSWPDNTAEAVRDALTTTVQRLPDHLWQSLTWDQGKEMANTPNSVSTAASKGSSATRKSLAAGNQREHQRTAPPILSQRSRHEPAHPNRPRQRCPFAQRTASTDPGRDVTIRETRRRVAMTP